MLPLTTEVVYRQLNKNGEELCGDRVEVVNTPTQDLVVMSDGLGSGVKANILSSLTTKIIATMLREGCSIHEVADTLNQTLPVCKVRGIAYSTFTAIRIKDSGKVEAAEYDNPELIWFSSGKLKHIPHREVVYSERMKIKESDFSLKEDDFLIAISDGVVHAGIGRTWNLGWSWDRVAQFIKTNLSTHMTAQELCDSLADVVNKLYVEQPGDDATIVVLHYRKTRLVTVMIGPPQDQSRDIEVVEKFVGSPGKKIVCGGTTGNIVSNYLGKPIDVLLHTGTKKVPAIGKMESVDLVTEGVLTLSEVVQMLRGQTTLKDLKYQSDGASLLLKELLNADEINILLGKAINPAHQNPETPTHLGLKFHLIEELHYILIELGKKVSVEKF